MTAVHGTRAAAAKLEITAGLAFYNVSQFLHLIEFPIIHGKIIIYFHHCQGYARKLFPFCVIISPYLTMRLLFSLQAERLRRYPCKNISFAQAFLYLSSHLGNHLIFRIQLESALVDGQLSGPVRHEKSCPPGTLRSASFLMACPAILEIGHCPRKNNTDCHLAAAVSHALPPWSKSIGACLRCEGNSAHPLELSLICPLEVWPLLAAESHQQSISVRSS